MSNGVMCSPGKLPKKNTYRKNQKISAIGSGLVLSHELVTLLVKKYGSPFDGNFAFYGVDTTFMLRLKKLKLVDKVRVINGFSHSLSRNEKESDEVKLFREREMALDVALTLRHYKSRSSLKRFFRKIKESNQGKNRYLVKEMFKCLFSGKHPRCK